MKQLILLLTFSVSTFCGFGQDFFDTIFAKYSGDNTIVSISIGKELLSLATSIDNPNSPKETMDKCKELKILVQSKSTTNKNAHKTFVNNVLSYVEKSDYLKLMEVTDSDTKLNFYARKSGKTITHLVMIGGECDEEIFLSLKGEFTTTGIVTLGESGKSDGLSHLLKLKSLENN